MQTKFALYVLQVLGTSILITSLTACGGGSSGQSDPTLQKLPIAYVKRPLTATGPITRDLQNPAEVFLGQVELHIKSVPDPAVPSEIVNVSAYDVNGDGMVDIKDVDIAQDGNRVIFAMITANPPADSWNIYEYTISTKTLRPVITSVSNSNGRNEGDDINPHYLADGKRVIFSSTRRFATQISISESGLSIPTNNQGKPNIVTEARNRAAFNLHIMDNDGTNIKQVSFNPSNDLYPTVMHSGPFNGRIVFTRWDHMGSDRNMHLYTMHPDGADTQYLYGLSSHNTTGDTVQYVHPRQMNNGSIISLIRRTGTAQPDIYDGGDIAIINTNNFVDNNSPISGSGTAQRSGTSLSISTAPIAIDTGVNGRFSSVYPMLDGSGTAIVSYSDCYAQNNMTQIITACRSADQANSTVLPPNYGIYKLTLGSAVLQVITKPEANFYYTDVAAAQDWRSIHPAIVSDTDPGTNTDTGVINIRNVRDIDGTENTGLAAASVRFITHTYLPNGVNNALIGANTSRQMRQIVGYAPVYPDGSVRARVPANIPLSVHLLDSNGRRITSTAEHNVWFSVRPNEELTCNGCHATNASRRHGRHDAELPSVNTKATTDAEAGTTDYDKTKVAMNIVDTNNTPIYRYTNLGASVSDGLLDITLSPINISACETDSSRTSACRIRINYETNIQPLWGLARTVNAVDVTCTNCHRTTELADPTKARVPDGQLDLVDAASATAGQKEGYVQLVTAHPELALDNVNNVLIQTGNTIPAAVSPGAANSSNFFSGNRFGTGGTHENYLTPGELKLITEWIEIGAQNWNQP